MNVTVNHDASGVMYFSPDQVTIPSGNSTVSVTMVPPSGAGWTITSVSSDPSATWSSNTALLPEGEYRISIEASPSSQNGTSNLLITVGV
jgi:hypothetical protein